MIKTYLWATFLKNYRPLTIKVEIHRWPKSRQKKPKKRCKRRKNCQSYHRLYSRGKHRVFPAKSLGNHRTRSKVAKVFNKHKWRRCCPHLRWLLLLLLRMWWCHKTRLIKTWKWILLERWESSHKWTSGQNNIRSRKLRWRSNRRQIWAEQRIPLLRFTTLRLKVQSNRANS